MAVPLHFQAGILPRCVVDPGNIRPALFPTGGSAALGAEGSKSSPNLCPESEDGIIFEFVLWAEKSKKGELLAAFPLEPSILDVFVGKGFAVGVSVFHIVLFESKFMLDDCRYESKFSYQ